MDPVDRGPDQPIYVAEPETGDACGPESLFSSANNGIQARQEIPTAIIIGGFDGHEIDSQRDPPFRILIPVSETPDGILADARVLPSCQFDAGDLLLNEMRVGFAKRFLE